MPVRRGGRKACNPADRTKGRVDSYLEIKQREEARKAKGLPPRKVILPDWDYNDEKRYEDEQAEKKKHAASRRRKKTKRRAPKLANPPQRSIADSQPNATPTHEEGTHQ